MTQLDTPLEAYAGTLDRRGFAESMARRGWHVLPGLLSHRACIETRALYDKEGCFRNTIVMQRHAFGRGEYKYFQYPLPPAVETMRTVFYPVLAALANEWEAEYGRSASFPDTHADYLAQCRAAGQTRSTPLLLRYRAGDYNCLHQDLYGAAVFPLQMAVLLSAPGDDFDGGEFVLTEQRPRMQSRAHVVPLRQGDAVIFAVNEAPRRGTRGTYRVKLRHGVSEIRRGERYTLGVIFHDAA